MSRASRPRRTPVAVLTFALLAFVIGVVEPVHAAGSDSAVPARTAPVGSGLPGGLQPWTQLVVQSDGLGTVRVDGSGARVLGLPSGAEHPDWSPDGRRIAFDVAFSSIWTASAQGTHLRRVFTCELPCIEVSEPAWSPDGRRLAIRTVESEDGENTSRSSVLVVDLMRGDVCRVLSDPSGLVWFYGPRWAPSGDRVVVEADTWASRALSEETRVALQLITVRSSGGPGRVVAEGLESPDWSPTGQLLVGVQDDNLVVVRPDGSHRRAVTTFDGLQEHAIQPTFTPDGTGIVFTYVTGQFGVDDFPTAGVVSVSGSGFTTIGGGGLITHPRVRP